jgi:hypothetical protein
MIRMERPVTAIPADWKAKADIETRNNIAMFKAAKPGKKRGRKAPPEPEFTFKAYGHILLRRALNKTYLFKCAYCETFYGAVSPVAVEHYRPKGAIIEGKRLIKPGYFWLAAEWENLLPSCSDCNSPRRQDEDDGKSRVRGKGNFFPIAKGSRRARAPGSEKKELPLLLHPERDFPEEHLEFPTDRRRLGLVIPARKKGKDSPRGQASIEYYALDRPQLKWNREQDAKRLLAHLRNTRQSLRDFKDDPTNAQRRKLYEENIEDLQDFIAPGQQYLALMRTILREEFPEFASKI